MALGIFSVKFSDEEIAELSRLLSEKENVQFECELEMSGIWLHSADWQSELRLLILLNQRLTVSRVCFQKRRSGTMTVVLEWLKSFCAAHDIPSIVIQCVETPEMAAWCEKNAFSPIPVASFLSSAGFVAGDYQLVLTDQKSEGK